MLVLFPNIWFRDESGHTLYRGRRYLNDLDRRIPELVTETEDECIQGGFGGGVAGKGSCGDDGGVGTRAVVVSKQSRFSEDERMHVLH